MKITRGVTFRCYDVCGLERAEAAVEDGVISFALPEELKTPAQAYAAAEMLRRAACELSTQVRPEPVDDGN